MSLKEILDSSGFMFSLSWSYQAGFAVSSSNRNRLHRGKKENGVVQNVDAVVLILTEQCPHRAAELINL
jgi:hypothetical protein